MADPKQMTQEERERNRDKGPACSRYAALAPAREQTLVRARRAAALTIPSLFRESGANETTDQILPWQSLGAAGVNNLAAKLVLTWFPPAIPFIKLKQTRDVLLSYAAMDEDVRGDLKAKVDKGLAAVEREFLDCIAEDGDRVVLFDAVRHAVVGGNHGIKLLKDDTLESLHLEQYVTVRGPGGKLLEFIVEDELAYEELDQDLQDIVKSQGYEPKDSSDGIVNTVKVYTHGKWSKVQGKWVVHQEIWSKVVPGSKATYEKDDLPFIFFRFNALRKEHYGRSYCEDLEADLTTYDGFWQLLTEGTSAIALLKWLIKPGGTVNKRTFEQLPNGGVMTGDPEDVMAVRAEKGSDLQQAFNIAERLERRLEYAFVMQTAIQRSGERVTAEEIRIMSQALERALGGVYANGVSAIQAPYGKLKLGALMKHKRVTPLPKGTVNVTILTGEDALGRMLQAQGIDDFLLQASQVLGTQALVPYVNVSNYLDRAGANKGVDTDGLIKSQETVQAEQQQLMQQQTLQGVAPELVKQGGEMLQNYQNAANEQALQGPPPEAAPVPAA